MNGNRRTRFIDATPNHRWVDFDNWKVNGAENSRHNKIHWAPYVENLSGSYKIQLNEFSKYDEHWIKSKFLQTYHIEVKNSKGDEFRNFLTGYKEILQDKLKGISFVWMKTISGGSESEYQLFIGLNQMEDFKLLEDIFNFSNFESGLVQAYDDSVTSSTSELWQYSERLSLIITED